MLRKFIRASDRILRNRLTSRLFSSARFSWELAGLSRALAMEAILRGFNNEEEFWKTGEKDASRLFRFIDNLSIVLDVGCGIGRVMKFIAPNCKEIIGVDTSSLILRRAKRELTNFKNCHFYRQDFKRFSVSPYNSFDLIYSFYTLQHMEKEDAYVCLRSMQRLLKPNGTICLQFPDFTADHYFSLFEEYALGGSKYGARVRAYTKPEIEKLLQGARIKMIEYAQENENVFVTGAKEVCTQN
jgi:ubiquinone/menaquinone biosynthesis C-methylase UbiE